MRKLTLQLLLLTLISIFLGCGGGNEQANSGGSGSEIVGVVQTTDEEGSSRYARADYSPISHFAPIYLLQRTQKGTKLDTAETYTDPTDGSFRIAAVDPGQYLLEAVDTINNKSLVRYVEVNGDGKQRNLGNINLENPKSIVCTVKLPSLPWPLNELPIKYRVYVLGTRVSAEGNNTNIGLDLENIPLGVEHYIQFEMIEPVSGSKRDTVDVSKITSIHFDINLEDLSL